MVIQGSILWVGFDQTPSRFRLSKINSADHDGVHRPVRYAGSFQPESNFRDVIAIEGVDAPSTLLDSLHIYPNDPDVLVGMFDAPVLKLTRGTDKPVHALLIVGEPQGLSPYAHIAVWDAFGNWGRVRIQANAPGRNEWIIPFSQLSAAQGVVHTPLQKWVMAVPEGVMRSKQLGEPVRYVPVTGSKKIDVPAGDAPRALFAHRRVDNKLLAVLYTDAGQPGTFTAMEEGVPHRIIEQDLTTGQRIIRTHNAFPD